MKRLISTTAVAALLALPVAAQQTTQGTEQQQVQSTDQQQMQQMALAGGMEVEATELIGKRLYIQRDGQQQGMQTEPQQETGAAAQTGETGTQPVEQPATEGEVAQTEQQVQPSQQDQTAQSGQTGMQSGQADGQQVTGQQTAGMEGVTDPRERWQTAGRIEDILMSQDGQVEALVIDAGGFLGGGQGERQVGIQDVEFVPNAENQDEFFVVYTGDRSMFEQSQPFDEAALQPGQQRGTTVWGEEMRGQQAEVSATDLTSDELVGTSIYGPNDDWVGDVSDLALTEDGQIEAVIVDVGGFLGIGNRSVALSMEEIQLRRGEGGWFGDELRVYVDSTQEELEQLPEWEQPG